jgi:hypothetical protein
VQGDPIKNGRLDEHLCLLLEHQAPYGQESYAFAPDISKQARAPPARLNLDDDGDKHARVLAISSGGSI